MKKFILFFAAAVLLIVSCQKNIAPKTEVAGKKVGVIHATKVSPEHLQLFLAKHPEFANARIAEEIPSAYRGHKISKVKLKAGFAPLIDSCCTFGAVGSVDTTIIHMSFVQIKPLQEGETFQ